jgi:hypothetical protein
MDRDGDSDMVKSAFIFGVMLGVVAIMLFVNSPEYNTLYALCNQKYGTGNWVGTVSNGYWSCGAVPNVVCQVDGIGVKECQNSTKVE